LSDGIAKIDAMNQYTFRAEWSPDYGEYVGLCLEFPARFARAATAHEAIEVIEQVIVEELADLAECGTEPPPSLTDRRYSGNFMVRTSPTLHARLTVEATEEGVSLNQWVVQKLAGRRPPTLSDLF
jgi:predicted HicB family RNase H-like nuclease